MGVSGLLLLDKDQDWTSQDCVSKLRGILGERRIGHAGTLDPLATGLLVVLVGRATRASSFAEAEEKEYIAAFRPGVVTDTQDITGNLLRQSDVLPTEAQVRDALAGFVGQIQQLPPMYSAIKINGQKLYDIARRGGTVERQKRTITIHSLEHLGMWEGDHLLRIRCSKGTYIRTLCHDLGEVLGCGGCMSALRRTASGAFRVESAARIGDIDRSFREKLLPIDSLFPAAAPITLTAAQEQRCRCGNSFPVDADPGQYRFYAPDGSFLALGQIRAGQGKAIKSFFEVTP